jgi:cell division protein FtsB
MQRRQPGGQGPVRRPRGTAPVRMRGSRDGERSSSRPAAARRAAAAGAAKRTTAPSQGGLTGRATVLLVVLAALALGYAYPVRVYLTQTAEIEALQRAQQDQAKHIDDLAAEAAKWQDDEYVRIQVRSRLYWVYPGETPLVPIFDPEGQARDSGTLPAPPPPPDTWYGTLWSSLDGNGKGK